MHVTTLIELAIQRVERKSVRGLAERMGVSHTKVSEWKNGAKPIPEERIQQLAKIAGQDAGPWLLLIKSQQEEGELGRLWASLAKKLGAVAGLLLVAALPYSVSAKALNFFDRPGSHFAITGDTAHYVTWWRYYGGVLRDWLAHHLHRPKPSPGCLEARTCL